MGQLDILIERIQPGQELVLESDKQPSVRAPDGLRAIIKNPLSSSQISALLLEVAPPEKKDAVKSGNTSHFIYELRGSSYNVSCMASGENIRCVIRSEPALKEAVVNPAEPAAAGDVPEIETLLKKMVEMGSSDLHLTSNHRPTFRCSGTIVELDSHPVVTPAKMKSMIYAIMPESNASQFEELHDTDFPFEIPGFARFRVNVFLDRFGIGAVLRHIPIEIVTAEKLGLSKEVLDLCHLSKGLVLVTGPTGSGKSTTLCALIDYINRNRKEHIITIEDPIEFVHEKNQCLINQREVHVHTKSFSNALRAALREDPDIILVGELRDLETIAIALETAETGHLVFGTLHTTSAASTVDRIIDQFPADRQEQIRTMLASSLKGVISQTLCKKTGGGRVAAQEILFVTSAVANLIREGKVFQIHSVMQTSKSKGMVLLNDALMALVLDKKVSPEDAYIKATDKEGFTRMLDANGVTMHMAESN